MEEREFIRVLLADDHPVVREGLRSTLPLYGPIKIVAEAEDGEEAVTLAREFLPDIILMDIRMPDMTGIEATEILTRDLPQIKVVMLTMYDNPEYVKRLVEAGCKGYLLKDSGPAEMVDAMQRVHRGEKYFSSRLVPTLVKAGEGIQDPQELSAREKQVLVYVVEGLSNKQIGRAMVISTRTVEKHREHVMFKTRCTSVGQLVRYAMDKGYLVSSS